MRGMLKYNWYASLSNMKVFMGITALLGFLVVTVDTGKDTALQNLLISYALLCPVGFSWNAISSLGMESGTKWGKYKLTTPVRRADIVRSDYINQALWLIVGELFAAVGVSASVALHGFPFDVKTDVLMLFVVGVGISLLMGAVFFPLAYLGGEERCAVFLIISLLGGGVIFILLVTLINMRFPKMTTGQIVLAALGLFSFAVAAFLASCRATIGILGRKEY